MFELYTDIEILDLLGSRIKDQRLNQNISQQDMADFCGVSRRTVSLLENGKGISLLSFIRILRKLNLEKDLVNLVPEPVNFDPFHKDNTGRKRASK